MRDTFCVFSISMARAKHRLPMFNKHFWASHASLTHKCSLTKTVSSGFEFASLHTIPAPIPIEHPPSQLKKPINMQKYCIPISECSAVISRVSRMLPAKFDVNSLLWLFIVGAGVLFSIELILYIYLKHKRVATAVALQTIHNNQFTENTNNIYCTFLRWNVHKMQSRRELRCELEFDSEYQKSIHQCELRKLFRNGVAVAAAASAQNVPPQHGCSSFIPFLAA